MENYAPTRLDNYTVRFASFLAFAVMLAIPVVLMAAGGDGGPLGDVYDSLTDWTQGNIGKVITIACIIVGIVMGVARQSLLAFAIGIGMGLGLYNTPTIVDWIFQATL